MKITPMDIAHKDFNRGLRGFNVEEVKEFLEEISVSLEEMLQERAQLLGEIESLKQSLGRFHSIEDNLQSALMLAQKTSEETVANAKKKAELIIEDARRQGRDIEAEFAQLKARKRHFELELKVLLETHLKQLEDIATRTGEPGDGL